MIFPSLTGHEAVRLPSLTGHAVPIGAVADHSPVLQPMLFDVLVVQVALPTQGVLQAFCCWISNN
jgi:hypothetical protein